MPTNSICHTHHISLKSHRCMWKSSNSNKKTKIEKKQRRPSFPHLLFSYNSSLKAHTDNYTIFIKNLYVKMLHFNECACIYYMLYASNTVLEILFISLFHTFTSYCRPYPSHVSVVCERGLYSISHDIVWMVCIVKFIELLFVD